MIWCVPNDVECAFQSNLRDWCDVNYCIKPNCRLGTFRRTRISVDAALEKNPVQASRWHIEFLKNHSVYDNTPYWNEYLIPNYASPIERADSFLELFASIQREGIKKPIWVVEAGSLGLGFDCFRFDGCHRLCSAKVLGMTEIDAIVFKLILL